MENIEFLPVVGLEIHVQIKTKSKMFCSCDAEYFGSEPNINICPTCYGLPGALPVPNKLAFQKALKLAIALQCKINRNTKFDRKNYFYPDLPKGYQISQYDFPIGENGFLEIEINGDSRRIRIHRVHLEEDTGKSIHENGVSFIDYNKSGVPLLEIVTEPDFESTEEVIQFAKRLRQTVRALEISDAEMQKGQMRFELNVSLKKTSDKPNYLPNYKAEIKNIGSISVLEKVLENEIIRQSEILKTGGVIKSQTRGLKDMTGETVFQRAKESADDYRYFPEPDIPPIIIKDEEIDNIKEHLPELPSERKLRYINIGLEGEQADIFIEDIERGSYFEDCLSLINLENERFYVKEFAKWIVGELSSIAEKNNFSFLNFPIRSADLLQIIKLIKDKKISGTIAKKVFSLIIENPNESTDSIINKNNLIQVSDSSEIEVIVDEVLNNNKKIVEDLVKNPNAIKFLVGQVMRVSKGKVNPVVAEEELRRKLNLN